MKEALAKALVDRTRGDDADKGAVDRILAAAFFRRRPLQAGSAPVIALEERRAREAPRR